MKNVTNLELARKLIKVSNNSRTTADFIKIIEERLNLEEKLIFNDWLNILQKELYGKVQRAKNRFY